MMPVDEFLAESAHDPHSLHPIKPCSARSPICIVFEFGERGVIHFQEEARQHDDFDLGLIKLNEVLLVVSTEIISERAEARDVNRICEWNSAEVSIHAAR